MVDTEPKNKRLQARYKKDSERDRILLSVNPDPNKAIWEIVLKYPKLIRENRELKEAKKYYEEKFVQLTSGKENTYLSYLNCPDSHSLPNEPSKRRCSRKESDRWITLRKEKGMSIVDDPHQCEICLAREKLLVELSILSGKKKVTRKEVFLAEAKKRHLQEDTLPQNVSKPSIPTKSVQYNGGDPLVFDSPNPSNEIACPMLDGKLINPIKCEICKVKAWRTWQACKEGS